MSVESRQWIAYVPTDEFVDDRPPRGFVDHCPNRAASVCEPSITSRRSPRPVFEITRSTGVDMAEANGGQPTRDERIQRQDRDRGDPNDDVLAGNFMYHVDDGDCRVAGDFRNLRPMSRRAAKRRWLAPCMVCVLEVTVK